MPITGPRAVTAAGGMQKVWALPESLDIIPLISDLGKVFHIQPEKEQVKVRKWFDSDDWRLYRGDLMLFQERYKWHLIRRDSDEPLATFSGPKGVVYRYASDFPVSRMRTLLEPILSIRSVQHLFTQVSSTTCVRILNRDRKTIALVSFAEYATRETGAVFRSVVLKGMRGYDRGCGKVSGFFSACGVTVEVHPHAAFDEGVHSIGRTPLDYSSKFRVDLQPEMTARSAMVLIYRELLATIEHNEHGVVSDLDTEFLHDFRVAVRRTRSGLAQVKKVLPPEVASKVTKDFSWLGSATGATRDLDVCLLERNRYLDRLPEKLRSNLDIFFLDMKKRRDREQKKLVRILHSSKYREVIGYWHAYLQGQYPGKKTPNSERPAGKLAREIIFRKYKKVLKGGRSITRSSSDEDIHRLRIQCKKLRYILEFFTSLFPAAEMELAIKQLKKLQDNLGRFNDLSVQQEMLRKYLAGLRAGSRQNQELATAIGGLLTSLHHEQRKVRNGFSARFHQFSGEENQMLYAKLFRR